MRIDGREIGPGHPPFIVAEVAGEHCGNIGHAFELINKAKKAGADAAKLQLFHPLKLAEARGGPDKVLEDGPWKGRRLYDLYTDTQTPREWFPILFRGAKDIGITIFSSVFDEDGVDFLETLNCPAYKISSFDLTNLPLIRKAAATGKPLIISTGMANHEEIVAAINETCDDDVLLCDLAILHCVSAYPCPPSDANLHMMVGLEYTHEEIVGFSDHTIGATAAIVATAMGAKIIEKHITLDRNNGGPDASFSLEPVEFEKFVQDIKNAYASIGTSEERPASEAPYRDLRRKA